MAGDTNLVEDAMELGNNVVDLVGQVARVYRHWKHKPWMRVTLIDQGMFISNWRQSAWQSSDCRMGSKQKAQIVCCEEGRRGGVM